MKLTSHLAASTLASLALTTTGIQAATYYWDNNGVTAGFGTAAGTWAAPTVGSATLGWGTVAAGTTAPTGSITTLNTNGTTDAVNFGSGATGLATGTITVGTVNAGNMTFASGSGAILLSTGTITLTAAQTTTVDNAADTINSILAGAGTSFTKSGSGSLLLTGANSYAGTTIINGGTVNLGGGTATGSIASTVLTLGGGVFGYTRTDSQTKTFTTTNINAGATVPISVVSGNILNLGTVTRGTGGRADFSATGAGIVAADTVSNDATGIMPGLRFGDSWAVANGAGVAISGLAGASYTLTSVAGATAANYSGFNIDVDSSAGVLDADITANSLRFSAAAANTMTLTGTANVITSGGILIGSGVGGNLSIITGGTLAGAASKDLSIIQNNASGGLTISSIVGNSGGATALIKSGTGLLTLSSANTFTGGLTINAGKVALDNAGALFSTPGSENAVTFGIGTSGTLALNGNSVVVRSLGTNATTAGSAIVENANVTPATLTIGNSGNAASAFAGVIQDGTGGGALALTKGGSGTLTLSGANTYSGGSTLTAGTVAINNAASFGASTGAVSVTGSSRINASGVGNPTYANAINVGAALTLQIPNATPGTATFPGQLSGSSAITVAATGFNGVTGTYAFTNTNNTFTGDIIMPAGTTGTADGNDFFTFSSIGDGGNFSFRKRGHTNAIIYTGSSAITFNTRQIALSSDFGGLFDGGGVNPVDSFRNNATNPLHTVTFKKDLTPGAIFSAGSLFFGGSNLGDNTFDGIISNPSNFNLGIGKSDGGKWIFTRDNTFLGNVKVSGGTLSVGKIDLVANAQPLGKGTIIELGHQNTAGTLEFTGNTTNSTTDKQVQMGNQNSNVANAGGAVILNNGSRSLTFTNAAFNPTVTTVTATRTLTLGGSYNGSNGANEIQGVLQDNVASTGKVALTVTGSIWKLSGANKYTGTTTVSAGTLLINGNQSTATGAVNVNGTSTLGGSGTLGGVGSGTITVAAGAFLAPGAAAATAGTLSIGGGLNISAQAGGAGTLNVDLDALANPSDKIAVTGTLTIGSGLLGFGDFAFTNLGGLQSGTYKLITSGAISGTLDGANLTGSIGSFIGALQITGNDLELVVTSASGYASWQSANTTGQAINLDHDNDGVLNGVEYFLGGTIDTTGFTPLPTVVNTLGTLSVTWTKAATYPVTATYGTDFVVETSDTLIGTWTTETEGGNVTITGNDVKYTFPAPLGSKKFARLRVTGP